MNPRPSQTRGTRFGLLSLHRTLLVAAVLGTVLAVTTGCGPSPADVAADQPHKHVHHPPHGGVPVVLGDEVYHLELVMDAPNATLQVYILDGEMEDFIRSAMPSFEVTATVDGAPTTLVFTAVPDTATGETVGDTSLFEAHAGWLKTHAEFDGVIQSVTIRGSTFSDVKFNYPKGNDTD